ncbi:DUF4189 domain-containing protein [Polaromonas sp. AET17H-212]|uniref:DUF4189 domain-containing protein n=1 Tax=Polaromonas sp. AET17H-212 TaxID=1977061 RepID=UPI000BBC5A65|nr:DUF4189 domain-containing protein [Polaromonas sp. AET17H-212]
MISGIKAISARLAFALLLSFVGGQAMAAGALAIDSLQGEKYGFSYNHPTTNQAEHRAMRECGSNCAVVLRFRAECGAYAADQAKGSNAYGWGTGATSSAVQQRALSECRAKGGSSCKVRAWGCDATKASADEDDESKDNNAASTEFQMQGNWQVDYAGSAGFPYNGTLRVNEKSGNGVYRGVMVLAYTNNQGQAKKIQQNMLITVRGNTVTIKGSNPVYLQGSGNYDPDNYTMTISSASVLRGQNNDAGGAGGSVVISRR